MAAPVTSTKLPRTGVVIGTILVVVSIVAVIAAIAIGGVRVASTAANAPVLSAPGTITTSLDAGRHSLWPEEGRATVLFTVTITGPGGEDVPYRRFGFFGSTSSITKNGKTFEPDGFFEAPTSGQYTVRLEPRPDTSTIAGTVDVLVGPADGYVGDVFLVIFVVVVLSGLVFLVGVIVLIVGLVHRSRAKKAGRTPPGGYPGYGSPQPYPQPGYAPQPGPAPQPHPPPGYPQPPPQQPPPHQPAQGPVPGSLPPQPYPPPNPPAAG